MSELTLPAAERPTASTDLRTTEVNLSGLVELLGRHLYSTPNVVVRELVQNAHDSCRRRQIEDDVAFEPSILVRGHPRRGRLEIVDNGAGLTHEEIVAYLATVASGYTRVAREREGDDGLIGYFGLGFLSAYVVSGRIELHTTSYQDPERGWLFRTNGLQRYSIEPAEPRAVGTSLVLELRPDFAYLADDQDLYTISSSSIARC